MLSNVQNCRNREDISFISEVITLGYSKQKMAFLCILGHIIVCLF